MIIEQLGKVFLHYFVTKIGEEIIRLTECFTLIRVSNKASNYLIMLVTFSLRGNFLT